MKNKIKFMIAIIIIILLTFIIHMEKDIKEMEELNKLIFEKEYTNYVLEDNQRQVQAWEN